MRQKPSTNCPTRDQAEISHVSRDEARATRWRTASRGPARVALRALAAVFALAMLSSCGGGLNAGPGAFQGATSNFCDEAVGIEALYWDYMNGVIRVDYPETYRFIPYAPGSSFIHPEQPLYSFIYPSTWSVETLFNPGSQLTGVNVIRSDGRAVWRRLNYTVSGTVSATQALNEEINLMLGFMGSPGPIDEVCFGAIEGRAAMLLRSGSITANVSTQTFVSGGLTVILAQVAVAPTAEYDNVAYNVFFPLSGQMNLGGGSSDPQCDDGIDNDGDGLTDFPNDPGCTSPSDDSEAG